MKVFVLSQPKSGTYLASALLSFFNLKESYLHLSLNSYHSYNKEKIEEGQTNPDKFISYKPLCESINLVQENHIAVGHIPCTNDNIMLLNNFKKVYINRPAEDRIESAKRWSLITGRQVPKVKKPKVTNWMKQKDVFTIDFNKIKNKDIDQINFLQIYLFNKVKYDSSLAIKHALTSSTLTKS